MTDNLYFSHHPDSASLDGQGPATHAVSGPDLFNVLLATSSEGIALLTPDTRFIHVNSAFARLFNSEPAGIIGRTCHDLLTACAGVPASVTNARQHDIASLLHALQHQERLPATTIELIIQKRPCLLSVSVTPVAAAETSISLLLARDITPVQGTTHLKANILSLIAHELRAPLNTLNGYLDLALAGVGGELNEQQREFVVRARASSEHLYALLEDLLLIARADAGQVRLHQEVIGLAQVVALAVEELELMAADHGITVEVAIPSPFPHLYADAIRLQQVLRNLLSNALRFTPAGGHVRISAWMERGEPSEPGGEPVQIACLQVRDNGIGIPLAYQQRIFERFFQVPQAAESRGGGQGLGLTVVKLLVELHGGWVAVESAPGQGSAFTCRFPCVAS